MTGLVSGDRRLASRLAVAKARDRAPAITGAVVVAAVGLFVAVPAAAAHGSIHTLSLLAMIGGGVLGWRWVRMSRPVVYNRRVRMLLPTASDDVVRRQLVVLRRHRALLYSQARTTGTCSIRSAEEIVLTEQLIGAIEQHRGRVDGVMTVSGDRDWGAYNALLVRTREDADA